MKNLFDQAGKLPVGNTSTSVESYFRTASMTGLEEKEFSSERRSIRIFVNGAPFTAYMMENGGVTSIPLADFSTLDHESSQVRAIELPHVAGRLAWLALESQPEPHFSIQNENDWTAKVNQWKHDSWNGLVEITAKDMQGFALFWQGEIRKVDTIFSTPQGFVTDLPKLGAESVWEVTAYSCKPSTASYQDTVLRHAIMHWSSLIFIRYREIVGAKLLRMMNRDLSRQIEPWGWKIALEDNEMQDAHFFAYLNEAAHAYREIFMAMGAQMNVVLGNNLTRMLLNDTFEQICSDERTILQSLRLIPAAFSE
jgi:hypothetical protein